MSIGYDPKPAEARRERALELAIAAKNAGYAVASLEDGISFIESYLKDGNS